jgi:indole-3-glycerol phosphate synthase
MTILDQLAQHARERVEIAKQNVPLAQLKQQALSGPKGDFAFEKALQKPGMALICECKKASPSKGVIAADFPYVQIAKAYEAAGADCISVLTEPKWFLGRDEDLKEIAAAVSTPFKKRFCRGRIYDLRSQGAWRSGDAFDLFHIK